MLKKHLALSVLLFALTVGSVGVFIHHITVRLPAVRAQQEEGR